jgi:hypothetical protein
MSSHHNQVLTALAFHVAEHGTFPERERFRASQATHVAAFDELVQWRELFAWQGGTLIVWTIKALARIEPDVAFAKQELERARIVFDELVRMYHEALGRNHKVTELASRVGFTHDDQVRRAMMLLQPVGVFDDFAIWLGDIDERFRISESILTKTAEIFPKHTDVGENEPAVHTPESLSQRSMKLFLERFAEPFRERGDDPKLGARTGNSRVVLEFLKTRGLLEKDGVVYRLSDFGKEKALEPSLLAAILELEADNDRDSAVEQSVEPGRISSWEAAMHQLVDVQDELGSLAETLFRMLRQGRAHARSPGTELPPGSELQSLEALLKTGASAPAIRQGLEICEGLPGLEAAASMLERFLPQGRP